jgi:PAS domain S-box-containing protein
MDAAPALISYVDSKYRYRRVNQAYERWFGRAAKEIEGRPVREVLGKAVWEAIRPHMERAMAGEAVTFEQELPYKGAGPHWVYVTYTPDRDESGRVRGFVVHVVDIGELKRAEAQRFEANQRLQALSDGLEPLSGVPLPPQFAVLRPHLGANDRDVETRSSCRLLLCHTGLP